MKNLENYGIQVLDAKEIREVDGGQIDVFFDVWGWAFDELSTLPWESVFEVDEDMGIPISA